MGCAACVCKRIRRGAACLLHGSAIPGLPRCACARPGAACKLVALCAAQCTIWVFCQNGNCGGGLSQGACSIVNQDSSGAHRPVHLPARVAFGRARSGRPPPSVDDSVVVRCLLGHAHADAHCLAASMSCCWRADRSGLCAHRQLHQWHSQPHCLSTPLCCIVALLAAGSSDCVARDACESACPSV